MKVNLTIVVLLCSIAGFSQSNYKNRDIKRVLTMADKALGEMNMVEYQISLKTKDFGNDDTFLMEGHCTMIYNESKQYEDIKFRLEFELSKAATILRSELAVFDGENLYLKHTNDSSTTHSISNERNSNFTSIRGNTRRTLLLTEIFPKNSFQEAISFPKKMMIKSKTMIDTVLNDKDCYKIDFEFRNVMGTNMTKNNRRSIFFDKTTHLPIAMRSYSEFETMNEYLEYEIEYMKSSKVIDHNLFETAKYVSPNTEIKNNYVPAQKSPAHQVDTYAVLYQNDIQLVSGKTLNLIDLKGSIVVLDFWYRTCLPCIKLMPELKKIQEKYRDKNVLVIGINDRDDEKAIVELFQAKGLNYNTSFAGPLHFSDLLGINEFPTTLVLDQNGQIVHKLVGYEKGFYKSLSSILDELIER